MWTYVIAISGYVLKYIRVCWLACSVHNYTGPPMWQVSTQLCCLLARQRTQPKESPQSVVSLLLTFAMIYCYGLVAIHRLDRLTSGLLLFAKSLSTAQQLEQHIRERKVVKEYICRVQGKFPRSELSIALGMHRSKNSTTKLGCSCIAMSFYTNSHFGLLNS